MDVFGIAVEAGGEFLCDAALDAGYELGVFEALAHLPEPVTVDELGVAIAVRHGRWRLRALVDVLAALGALERRGDRFVAGSPPPRPVVPRSGWGLLASVIRDNQPLALERGEAERRMHLHLARAGAAAAREVAALVDGTSLLDLGGGAGAYTAAWLDAHPGATATLVDAADVIALAAEELARFGARVRLIAGDACTAEVGVGHGAVLLSNVLHLHAARTCQELCRVASAAVAPGGVVVIKELRVDDDRRGPLPGLLFALNMAIYTEAGDVYPTSDLRGWLARAGLVGVMERRLAAADDAVVMIGQRPAGAAARFATVVGADHAAAHAELRAELDRTAGGCWRQLAEAGLLDHDLAAGAPPALAFPAAFHRVLADALTLERGEPGPDAAARAANLVGHYTRAMPRHRAVQLAGNADPAATLFRTPLDWSRLPRLGAAIERLVALVRDAGVAVEVALGAPSADAFRARAPTLAALHERTHYGGFMPLLYAAPADLASFVRRGAAADLDVHATIDRYLTAPVVHELCHFQPGRDALQPPHLDECVAGWLGVHVHPELAYPAPGQDDAIYAAPWLAQVGQAIARGFGIGAVVRAHAGAVPWDAAVPAPFVDAAARLGWDDWRERRTLHFLSDTFDPAPWVGLALVAAAGRPLGGETLASLARLPLATLADDLVDDPDFDRAIVGDAVRAMCLDNARVDGSFRTRTVVPAAAIELDAVACAVTTPRRGDLDHVAPRSWLPPAVAARMQAAGLVGYELRLGAIAAIPEAAAAICAASPGGERAGFALIGRAARPR